MPEEDKAEKNRRLIGVLRIVILVQIVVIVALIIAFAVHSVQLKNEIASAPGPCPEASSSSNINLETPEVLPPFYDLTASEIRAVKDFLYNDKDLNLVKPSDIAVNASYIFTIELIVPNKQITLDYLDKRGAPPKREAKAIIFRGDKSESYIEEYKVGPLPNPVYKSDRVTVPFRYRPLTEPELNAAVTFLNKEVTTKAAKIIKESYDATMSEDCKEKCVDFQMMSTMASSVSGQPHTRKMWFWNARVAEFFSLHPLDFLMLVDLTSKNVDEYKIDKVFYGGDMFHSLDELVTAYEEGSLTKTRLEFPDIDKNLYSTLNRKGTLFPSEPLSPPITYEPSGKRYSINGRHVKYLGWDFDVRMSTISGPQLFDIKFFDERIVYELSLQEVAVFYSANSPAIRFADYVDSIALIGTRARSLVSGADCPDHSTFLSTLHVTENSDEPLKVDRAFCVFEHNTGLPLRRHLSGQGGKGKFYEGLMDTVLIIRTISTVVNYDYVFDFIFHQNGAIEVKTSSTGYVLTSLRFPPEDDYGFQIREHITGNLHHHLFHFKVDIDIHGTDNRFEAIDIVPEASDNTLWSDEENAKYHMTKMVRRQIKSEKEAAIDYNFDAPNYLTFYNKDFKTSTGAPKAYRLLNRGMSKQMFTKDKGVEPSVSWARHQIAVTKYKETEKRSSSMYAIWDSDNGNPVVNFNSYIEDNEVLTDQDQVAWVTMGVHHIPHTEDIPVTTTPGLDLRFFLLPNNYFEADPSIGSGDAMRIEPRDQRYLSHGININRYGRRENYQCMPRATNFDSSVQDNPRSLFEAPGDTTL